MKNKKGYHFFTCPGCGKDPVNSVFGFNRLGGLPPIKNNNWIINHCGYLSSLQDYLI
jgi:hypothetical protein